MKLDASSESGILGYLHHTVDNLHGTSDGYHGFLADERESFLEFLTATIVSFNSDNKLPTDPCLFRRLDSIKIKPLKFAINEQLQEHDEDDLKPHISLINNIQETSSSSNVLNSNNIEVNTEKKLQIIAPRTNDLNSIQNINVLSNDLSESDLGISMLSGIVKPQPLAIQSTDSISIHQSLGTDEVEAELKPAFNTDFQANDDVESKIEDEYLHLDETNPATIFSPTLNMLHSLHSSIDDVHEQVGITVTSALQPMEEGNEEENEDLRDLNSIPKPPLVVPEPVANLPSPKQTTTIAPASVRKSLNAFSSPQATENAITDFDSFSPIGIGKNFVKPTDLPLSPNSLMRARHQSKFVDLSKSNNGLFEYPSSNTATTGPVVHFSGSHVAENTPKKGTGIASTIPSNPITGKLAINPNIVKHMLKTNQSDQNFSGLMAVDQDSSLSINMTALNNFNSSKQMINPASTTQNTKQEIDSLTTSSNTSLPPKKGGFGNMLTSVFSTAADLIANKNPLKSTSINTVANLTNLQANQTRLHPIKRSSASISSPKQNSVDSSHNIMTPPPSKRRTILLSPSNADVEEYAIGVHYWMQAATPRSLQSDLIIHPKDLDKRIPLEDTDNRVYSKEEKYQHIPKWAWPSTKLNQISRNQSRTDADIIFPPFDPTKVSLVSIFKTVQQSYHPTRPRRSSSLWETDRLTQTDVDQYNKRAQILVPTEEQKQLFYEKHSRK